MNKKMLQHFFLMCTQTHVWHTKSTEYSCTVQRYRRKARAQAAYHHVFEFKLLSVNLRWRMKTVQEEEEKRECIFVFYQVLSDCLPTRVNSRQSERSLYSMCVRVVSVVFKEREKVIVAIAGKVWGVQVG